MSEQHHWSVEEDALIRQHEGSLTAVQLQKQYLPWRTLDSVKHRCRLLKQPSKKRQRFPLKRYIGTVINGFTVTGIEKKQRKLIAECPQGHVYRQAASYLEALDGCGRCATDDYVTVSDERDGKVPLTPERWLGRVIHEQTVVRIEGDQRVVVCCKEGHEATPVFPCNVLNYCRTCRRQRIQRLRTEQWLGKRHGERTVVAVRGSKLLVECNEGHRLLVQASQPTGCGECFQLTQAAEQWLGYTAGGRTIIATPKSSDSNYTVECERGHRAQVPRAQMETTRCQQCLSEDALRNYPEYSVWAGMKARCSDSGSPAWRNYGGRGIEVRFKNFMEFYDSIGPRPSLEHSVNRIDNDGHYEVGNVEWALPVTQARNRSSNYSITYKGRTQCVMKWAEELDVKYQTLLYYAHRCETGDEAVERAIQATHRKKLRERLLIAHGETKTYQEWADQIGCSIYVINGRVKLGWTPERIVATSVMKPGHRRGSGLIVEIDGVSMTIKEACELSGAVCYRTACDRIQCGWDPVRAVTEQPK